MLGESCSQVHLFLLVFDVFSNKEMQFVSDGHAAKTQIVLSFHTKKLFVPCMYHLIILIRVNGV